MHSSSPQFPIASTSALLDVERPIVGTQLTQTPKRKQRVRPRSPRSPSTPSTATSEPAGAHNSFPRSPSLLHTSSNLAGRTSIEEDRLSMVCGYAPSPLGMSASSSRRLSMGPSPASPPPPPRPPTCDPRMLIHRLHVVLQSLALDISDCMQEDEILDTKEQEMLRQDQAEMNIILTSGTPRVMGVPLRELALHPRKMTTTVLGGFRFDIPVVVFFCVEELYRTGIYKNGLFRDLPHHGRLQHLIQRFDQGDYGTGMSLHMQTMPDICALLTTYLSSLPDPILSASLFKAYWQWCAEPSIQREDEERRVARDGRPGSKGDGINRQLSPQTVWQQSRRPTSEYLLGKGDNDELEAPQIDIARSLLHLLPLANFSLLVYLCAFFTQIPLSPENGLEFDDIARIFGQRLFGGDKSTSRKMLLWTLRRWPRISTALLSEPPVDLDITSRRFSTLTTDSADSFSSGSSRSTASTAPSSVHSHDDQDDKERPLKTVERSAFSSIDEDSPFVSSFAEYMQTSNGDTVESPSSMTGPLSALRIDCDTASVASSYPDIDSRLLDIVSPSSCTTPTSADQNSFTGPQPSQSELKLQRELDQSREETRLLEDKWSRALEDWGAVLQKDNEALKERLRAAEQERDEALRMLETMRKLLVG